MERRKTFLHCAGILILLAALTGVCVAAGAAEQAEPDTAARPDLVKIDALGALGGLELPVVTFFHDRHTEALAKQGKSCDTCHKAKDGKMSLKYMRFEDTDFETVKNVYHDNCFACHAETKAKGEKSGPVDGECRRCHTAQPQDESGRMPAGFDNVLHYRHWDSKLIAVSGEKDNCAACHHVYDKAAQKTVYEKSKESTCRSCHEAAASEQDGVKVRALSDAAHNACVSCHREMVEAKKETGPVTCAGCHSVDGQAKIKANNAQALQKIGGELPRLKMKQPDAALLFPAPVKGEKTKAANMPPVAFNHLDHEKRNDTCRACHHKETVACGTCHTVKGSEKGGNVTLEQAMHLPASNKSCVGCHRQEQQKPQCAGCHAQMDTGSRPANATCASCHKALPQGVSLPESGEMAPEAKQAVAGMMLESARAERSGWSIDEIPEFVTIGSLSKEYQPSEFPHRKIVQTLIKGMKDDQLAQAFHQGDKAVCAGCHHNSPLSAKPPRCASCHDRPFDEATPGRPGLKAAYHSQCMSCHQAMGMDELEKGGKPMPAKSCVVCHDKKTD
ncbi:MAG: cytochrome c3 family protein [Desulfovibrionaceae bacterium]